MKRPQLPLIFFIILPVIHYAVYASLFEESEFVYWGSEGAKGATFYAFWIELICFFILGLLVHVLKKRSVQNGANLSSRNE
jgi:hypothetical protein